MAKVRTGLAKHGDGFFAMAQVNGKGQRGKTWVTEPGTNIILTLVMQPSPLTLGLQFSFSAAIALAAHDFFARYAGDETTIKWPNDIYWRDRKAGGILIESIIGSNDGLVATGEEAHHTEFLVAGSGPTGDEQGTEYYKPKAGNWLWAIVGMGININQTSFPAGIQNAVSLKQITGKDWDVIALAKELRNDVLNRFTQLLAGGDVITAYNERLFKKGQTARFKKGSRVFDGTVKLVNENGEPVLITSMEEHFAFGEIEWVLG